MKAIKQICEYIEEELDGAECYIKEAIKCKEEHKSLADVYYNLSMQEVTHVTALHEEVKKLIEAHRREKGEPPKEMSVIWEWEHQKHIDELKEIKILQSMY